MGVSNANSVGFAPLGIINGAVLVALLRPRNKDNTVTEEADLPRTTYYPEKGAASASSENDSWSIVCALLLQEILDCVLLDASYSRPPLLATWVHIGLGFGGEWVTVCGATVSVWHAVSMNVDMREGGCDLLGCVTDIYFVIGARSFCNLRRIRIFSSLPTYRRILQQML